MNKQPTVKTLPEKLVGYYLIPHELLHVLAFRLIGKPCHYDWGDRRVQYTARLSRREHLFTLLLPLAVCLTVSHIFHFIWIALALSYRMPFFEYLLAAPWQHFIFHVLANLTMLYCGTAYRDVRVALRLLFGQKSDQNSRQPRQQAVDE